jgi:hypothetical protein
MQNPGAHETRRHLHPKLVLKDFRESVRIRGAIMYRVLWYAQLACAAPMTRTLALSFTVRPSVRPPLIAD